MNSGPLKMRRCVWRLHVSTSCLSLAAISSRKRLWETYPVEVAGVGYKPLYDPVNLKPRT